MTLNEKDLVKAEEARELFKTVESLTDYQLIELTKKYPDLTVFVNKMRKVLKNKDTK